MADKKKKAANSSPSTKKQSDAATAKKASAAPAKKPNIFKRIGKYFRDTRGEFKKIVWPSRQTVLKNTMAVLVMVVIFAVVVWGLDFGLGLLRDWALKGLAGGAA